jgi:hypothetical protein
MLLRFSGVSLALSCACYVDLHLTLTSATSYPEDTTWRAHYIVKFVAPLQLLGQNDLRQLEQLLGQY